MLRAKTEGDGNPKLSSILRGKSPPQPGNSETVRSPGEERAQSQAKQQTGAGHILHRPFAARVSRLPQQIANPRLADLAASLLLSSAAELFGAASARNERQDVRACGSCSLPCRRRRCSRCGSLLHRPLKSYTISRTGFPTACMLDPFILGFSTGCDHHLGALAAVMLRSLKARLKATSRQLSNCHQFHCEIIA